MSNGTKNNLAYKIKELYEKLLAKSEGNASQAMGRMTELLGEEWKDRVNPEGIVLVEIDVQEDSIGTPPREIKHDQFFEKLRKVMLDEGMEVGQMLDNMEAPVKEDSKQECLKNKIKGLLDQL